MPDWFDKLIAFIKLPLKYLWVAALFSGLTLFLPIEMVKELGLNILLDKYRPWLGALFIFSSALATIDTVQMVWCKIKSNRLEAEFNSKLIEQINDLDPHEKSVLREFYLQNRKTLQLPFDNATVSGMLNHGILEFAGNAGERSLAGMLMPIKINQTVRNKLTTKMLGLPESSNFSKSDEDWLKNNRPVFMNEIARHNEVFHRRW
ncbi:hypothetical protein FCL40_01145 [Ferrimonas sediminicola]|uniref:Superinfection exclusion protein B n=1 Tax=Ferrimonas sediminicola TaxID=2569538 RepID=A0A4U1BJ45_9GAMM|nr:super-infection exclusion protein B [Ferrimonas sediminicola]TKB51192.1 hypothetical protein FCL40_01145 [Ferrimonas sediminicola]